MGLRLHLGCKSLVLRLSYLEGQGNFRLRMGIVGASIWLMKVISLLTSPADPPRRSPNPNALHLPNSRSPKPSLSPKR